MLETLNYTIRIGSTTTFLSDFDLNLNTVLVLYTTPMKAFLRLQDDVISRRDESCLLKRKPRYKEDPSIDRRQAKCPSEKLNMPAGKW